MILCMGSWMCWANTGVPLDSIGIEKIGDKTYIVHQVAAQETVFGISRRYNTPVNEIVQTNESLKEGLKVGQRILVPYVQKTAVPEGAIMYQVQQGETMFAISRKYNVSIQDIQAWNDLQGTDLSVGQALVIQGVKKAEQVPAISETASIADQTVAVATSDATPPKPKREEKPKVDQPAPKPVAAAEKPTTPVTSSTSLTATTTGNWKSHTVVQGETLFSIAQAHQAKVEDLISWNGLSSNNLSVGQTLLVGRETGATIPVTRFPSSKRSESASQPIASASPTAPPISSNNNTSTAFKNIKETGQAEVIEGTGNHKKYLVLHRNAPVGTIMRIRNEENDITIFARVVGTLPDTGDNSRLIVKVSKAAFDQLRAVNSRFPVEVSY